MRPIEFRAILLTAFALVPSGVHLAPNRIRCQMAQAIAQQIHARWALFGMKSSGDSLLDKRGEFRTALIQVFRATKAGALYAIIVFLIGFIFGTIRVLLLDPHLGETIAVIIEAPMILAASWFVCRWCVDRLDVRRTVPA